MLRQILHPSKILQYWSSLCSHSHRSMPDSHAPQLDVMSRNTGSGRTVSTVSHNFQVHTVVQERVPLQVALPSSLSLGEINAIAGSARTGVKRTLGKKSHYVFFLPKHCSFVCLCVCKHAHMNVLLAGC